MLKSFFDISKYKKVNDTRRPRGARPAAGVFDCSVCGLYKTAITPKLKPFGEFRKKVCIQGEAPGETEDVEGEPFCGKVGKFFRQHLSAVGINMPRDCVVINAVDCRPTARSKRGGLVNRPPTLTEIKCCYGRKVSVFNEYRPRVILLVGDAAINSFYGCDEYRRLGISKQRASGQLGVAALRGKIIPDRRLKAWVCHSYHPSYIVRGNEDKEHIFAFDMAVFASVVGRGRPSFDLHENSINALTDFDAVMQLLDDVWSEADAFAFDYETSSFRVHEGCHDVHMISFAHSSKVSYVFPYNMRRPNGRPWWSRKEFDAITTAWRNIMTGCAGKIAHNMKFEDRFTRSVFGVLANNWRWCTMTAAHVLDEARGVKSLKTQVFLNWGYHYGSDIAPYLKADIGKRNDFERYPSDKSFVYCGRDALFTRRLYNKQKKLIRANGLEKAYKLLHDGSLALARMEDRGIRFDVDRAERFEREWAEELKELKERVLTDPAVVRFEKLVGRPPGYKKQLSGKDLQILLYDILKLEPLRKTKTGFSVDDESLRRYADSVELIANELSHRKLEKRYGYLKGYLKLQVDGYIYPSVSLTIPRSYRSSSYDPNFQNVPVRDKQMAVLRSLFIPREGNRFLAGDYSSMEVRILACASRDGRLVDYIVGGGDMHRDWTLIVMMLDDRDERVDGFRSAIKNGWTFPLFYGSWYKSIAVRMPPPEHFMRTMTARRRAIRWERHLMRCERRFWSEFSGVRKWQDEKVKKYAETGMVRDDAWGFCRRGYLDRNKIYNFPIQGPAFHCLLWSIIQYEKNDFSSKYGMLVGQVHDEKLFDTPEADLAKTREVATRIMTEDIREACPWIIVPLEVEWHDGDNWLATKG